MIRFALARTAGALLLLGCGLSASAEAGIIVQFSSSDNFSANTADLDAQVTFIQDNTAKTLKIEINNLTTTPPYQLADLFFNAANALSFSVLNVSDNQSSGGPDSGTVTIKGNGLTSQQTGQGGDGINADGFGNFGWNLNWDSNNLRLAAGKTATFLLGYTGSISDSDLEYAINNTETKDGQKGPNIAVLHFYGDTTGFAGSGTNDEVIVTTTATTPEPSTFFGAGLAALAGLGYGWRRRGKSA
jgi:hypothetical protein